MAGNIKGIGLLSGGLDSMLAVKVLQEQQIELLAITFVTPFFGAAEGNRSGRTGRNSNSGPSIFRRPILRCLKARDMVTEAK